MGLKYSLINLFVFVLLALIARPLENYFKGIGGNIGADLAAVSNIICFVILLYISFGIVMKKTIIAVEHCMTETIKKVQ